MLWLACQHTRLLLLDLLGCEAVLGSGAAVELGCMWLGSENLMLRINFLACVTCPEA